MDITVIGKICDFSETIAQIKAVLVKPIIWFSFCFAVV